MSELLVDLVGLSPRSVGGAADVDRVSLHHLTGGAESGRVSVRSQASVCLLGVRVLRGALPKLALAA